MTADWMLASHPDNKTRSQENHMTTCMGPENHRAGHLHGGGWPLLHQNTETRTQQESKAMHGVREPRGGRLDDGRLAANLTSGLQDQVQGLRYGV